MIRSCVSDKDVSKLLQSLPQEQREQWTAAAIWGVTLGFAVHAVIAMSIGASIAATVGLVVLGFTAATGQHWGWSLGIGVLSGGTYGLMLFHKMIRTVKDSLAKSIREAS